MLIVHIFAAILSLAYTAFLCVSPTSRRLRVSGGLAALTLASGVYLVASSGSAIMPACLSGLVYLAVVLMGMNFARLRLSPARPGILCP